MRLDHALLNADVWPTAVEDLAPADSDHRPFVVTLAVRPHRRRKSRAAHATQEPPRADQAMGSTADAATTRVGRSATEVEARR